MVMAAVHLPGQLVEPAQGIALPVITTGADTVVCALGLADAHLFQAISQEYSQAAERIFQGGDVAGYSGDAFRHDDCLDAGGIRGPALFLGLQEVDEADGGDKQADSGAAAQDDLVHAVPGPEPGRVGFIAVQVEQQVGGFNLVAGKGVVELAAADGFATARGCF